jgi:hypothetical protein
VDVSIETIRKRTSKKELYEFIVHAKMPHARDQLPSGMINDANPK